MPAAVQQVPVVIRVAALDVAHGRLEPRLDPGMVAGVEQPQLDLLGQAERRQRVGEGARDGVEEVRIQRLPPDELPVEQTLALRRQPRQRRERVVVRPQHAEGEQELVPAAERPARCRLAVGLVEARPDDVRLPVVPVVEHAHLQTQRVARIPQVADQLQVRRRVALGLQPELVVVHALEARGGVDVEHGAVVDDAHGDDLPDAALRGRGHLVPEGIGVTVAVRVSEHAADPPTGGAGLGLGRSALEVLERHVVVVELDEPVEVRRDQRRVGVGGQVVRQAGGRQHARPRHPSQPAVLEIGTAEELRVVEVRRRHGVRDDREPLLDGHVQIGDDVGRLQQPVIVEVDHEVGDVAADAPPVVGTGQVADLAPVRVPIGLTVAVEVHAERLGVGQPAGVAEPGVADRVELGLVDRRGRAAVGVAGAGRDPPVGGEVAQPVRPVGPRDDLVGRKVVGVRKERRVERIGLDVDSVARDQVDRRVEAAVVPIRGAAYEARGNGGKARIEPVNRPREERRADLLGDHVRNDANVVVGELAVARRDGSRAARLGARHETRRDDDEQRQDGNHQHDGVPAGFPPAFELGVYR